MRRSFIAVATAAILSIGACSTEESAPEPVQAGAAQLENPVTAQALDPATGLIVAQDWELVRANCTPCHSAKLVTQQRGTAEQWLTMIRWMQAKQNLWPFDENTESRIIAYLADNYPPDAARRRAAIPPALMPPNPYSSPE
ncbi:MAG: hypothetical protein QNJ11_14335 [Woeseiaceae bacterium]|nr:hypothetical protein [Woeseiaceae bacterium]